MMRIPEIRFKEYHDVWEEKRLLDIIISSGTKNKDNLPLESYSISNDLGFVPQNEKFENGGTMKEANKSMYYIVSPNSFAYNPARINVGSIGYYEGTKKIIISSLYVIFSTDNSICDNHFLLKWFKSRKFLKLIHLYQEGGVRLYFFWDKLIQCNIPLPSKREQTHISNYIQSIDNLISSTEIKIQTLYKMKSACLQSMFPQEGESVPRVRFKGFTEEWKSELASNIFLTFNERNRPDLPVLSATQDRGMVKRESIGYNIFHDISNEATYKHILPGQFVIHLRSFQGGFAHSSIEGIASPAYTVMGFKDKNQHSDVFWKYIFSSKNFIKRLELITYGIRDGRSISFDEFKEMTFFFPSLKEQQKVANYFESLDKQISLQTQRFERLKHLKEACIDKMFV